MIHSHLIQKIGDLLLKYLDYGLMMGFFKFLLVVILKIIFKNLYSIYFHGVTSKVDHIDIPLGICSHVKN
jgi:hypothetical protein